MKTFFTIALIFLFSTSEAQDSKQEIKSQIKKVTVYLKGAQVFRESFLEIKPGANVFSIPGLSAGILEQSIQAEIEDSKAKIISVGFAVNYIDEIKKSSTAIEFENELKTLHERLSQEKSLTEVFIQEEEMLKSNKSIGGQQQGVKIEDLKNAVDYFRQRLTDIKQKLAQQNLKIEQLESEITKINAQLASMKNKKTNPSGEIILKVVSKTMINSKLSLSYLVNEAQWFPTYDIRAKDVVSPINIAYKANVSQQSGENWNQVKLTVSTGDPSVGGAKPIMNTWYLGYNNRAGIQIRGISSLNTSLQNEIKGRVLSSEDSSPLPGVNVVIKGTTVGTVTDVNGEYSIPLTADAQTLVFSFVGLKTEEVPIGLKNNIDIKLQADVTQLSEVVVVGYGSSGDFSHNEYHYTPKVKKTLVATPVVRATNIEYTIDEPTTVLSDGHSQTVTMIEYELNALFEYYCAPKIDRDAFLMARVLNWNEYNFLEGEANLFFEDKFLGKSVLDTRNTSDTLSISLGRDKNVLITRTKIKDLSQTQFASGNRKSIMAYEISARNKKQQPVSIVVEDQVPIATTKEITVDLLEDSHANYDSEKGLLKWKLNLPPAKTEKLILKYSIKFPKERQLILE